MLSMYGVVKTFYKGGVSQNFLSLFIQDKEQFSSISCVQYNIIIWNIILRKNLNPLFVLFWRVSQWFRGILNANEGADLLTVAEVKNEFASDILQWEIYSKKLVHCYKTYMMKMLILYSAIIHFLIFTRAQNWFAEKYCSIKTLLAGSWKMCSYASLRLCSRGIDNNSLITGYLSEGHMLVIWMSANIN